jgi:dienelactone hydrolase
MIRTPAIPAFLLLCLFCEYSLCKCTAQESRSVSESVSVHARLDLIDPADPAKGTIQSLEDWTRRRESIRKNIEVVMGPLPDRRFLEPVEYEVLEETPLDNGLIRRKIEYRTERVDQRGKEDRVRAYLLVHSKNPEARRPAVLCLHQTIGIGKGEPTGLGGSPNLHYALELAQRGYVTLSPDYPSFGEHDYDFLANSHWASGSMKAIWDNMRAIDLLERLPMVDPKRIGCIGHSLGGHNTIFTSFFDDRISVAVSSCGFTRFGKYYGGNLQGWTSQRYMPRIANNYSNQPELVPFDFPELIAGIAPRAFFTSSPVRDDNFEVSGVRETIEQASVIFRLYSAPGQLQAIYPDSAHDFPPEAREQAYSFIDRTLNLEGSLRN